MCAYTEYKKKKIQLEVCMLKMCRTVAVCVVTFRMNCLQCSHTHLLLHSDVSRDCCKKNKKNSKIYRRFKLSPLDLLLQS